jgi:outer membrane protein insertion porin family
MAFPRWLFVTLAFLASPSLAIEPFVIKDIRVEGIQRIEAGTVFSYLPVKVGETMTEEKAAQAIRALFGTGFFKDVSIEADGNVLVVALQERPSIAQVDFVGVKEFDKDALLKSLRQIGLGDGRIFDRSLLDRAEQELKRQYLSRGRYAVAVTTTITPLERNRVSINFSVDEGEVAKIRQISVIGAKSFREKDLVDLFILRTPGWMTWWSKHDQYSRQKLSADLESLRSHYLDRGYL